MRKLLRTGLALAVLVSIVLLIAPSAESSSTVARASYFTETGITTSGNQADHYMPDSRASCAVWGTWNGASATMQTDVEGLPGTALDVGVSAFVGATSDVPFTEVPITSGTYRLVITTAGASTDLNFHCRWRKDD